MTEYLFTSDPELTIWGQRLKSGPYKTTGDVSPNSPGEGDIIIQSADSVISNPLREVWKETLTPIKAGTDPLTKQWYCKEPLGYGKRVRDASFMFASTRNVKYVEAVRKYLLTQVTEPSTDFSNEVRFPLSNYCDVNPWFFYANWMTTNLMTFDFAKEVFSQPEKDRINKWFMDAALFYQKGLENNFNKLFKSRTTGDYTMTDPTRLNPSSKTTHLGGYKIPVLALYYNNRHLYVARFVTLVGVMYKNQSLIKTGKDHFKEFLKFSMFKDGTLGDMEKGSITNPSAGWWYSHICLTLLGDMADSLARKGDTSLYDYKTPEGLGGTEGGPKDLLTGIKLLGKLQTGEVKRHVGDTGHLITWTQNNNWWGIHDTWHAQYNLWYKDQFIKDLYTKKIGPQFPIRQSSGDPVDVFPGKLLMYGQMEDKVNPYPSRQPAPVVSTPPKPVVVDEDITTKLTELIKQSEATTNQLKQLLEAHKITRRKI